MDMMLASAAEQTIRQQSGGPSSPKKLKRNEVSDIGARLLKVLEETEALARLMRARLGDDAGDEIDDAMDLIVRSVDVRIEAAATANTKTSSTAH